jgi:cytochrome c oxidase assembly protein subunit 15
MAVPDWPRTYGANMFLYPLGSAGANVFLEHTHRLFGTLVGLASLTLLIWTVSRENRNWVKVLAGIAFALVVFQGILGGIRVLAGNAEPTLDAKLLRMAHGILAQLTFGTVVALAACLTPSFKIPRKHCGCGYPLEGLPHTAGSVPCPECGTPNIVEYQLDPLPMESRLRIFTAGFLHSSILQLFLGAAYRHFRDKHSLFSHMGFSIVVVIFGMLAGFAATSVRGEHSGLGPIVRRTGRWIVVAVGLQFILGWATFSMGGKGVAAESPGQALIRTVHQANGAFLLALAVLGFVWAKRLIRVRRSSAART